MLYSYLLGNIISSMWIFQVALSHIGHNAIYMPNAKLNDENIYLTYALSREVNSKIQLFNFLLDISNGEHLKYPFFKVGTYTRSYR